MDDLVPISRAAFELRMSRERLLRQMQLGNVAGVIVEGTVGQRYFIRRTVLNALRDSDSFSHLRPMAGAGGVR